MIWSLATNPKIPDSYAEIRRWRFKDVIAGHAVAECLAEVEDYWRRHPPAKGGH